MQVSQLSLKLVGLHNRSAGDTISVAWVASAVFGPSMSKLELEVAADTSFANATVYFVQLVAYAGKSKVISTVVPTFWGALPSGEYSGNATISIVPRASTSVRYRAWDLVRTFVGLIIAALCAQMTVLLLLLPFMLCCVCSVQRARRVGDHGRG